MSKILVTGADGVIGRCVTSNLRLNFGIDDVVATDLLPNKEWNINRMDVTNVTDVVSVFKEYDIDTVVHLAALVAGPPSEKRPWNYIHTNVMGTLNILENMRREAIPKLVTMSSWSTLGSDIELPITEDTPPNPSNPYGVSKVMCDLQTKLYAEMYGLEVIVLKPTMVYTPWQEEKNIVQQVVDCMKTRKPFEIWGEGTHTRELLHGDDLANIIYKCIDHKPKNRYEVFITGTENPRQIREVVKLGQEISHFDIVYVPSTKYVFSQRSDMTKIKNVLGIDTRDFIKVEDGLLECLIYRKNRKRELV